jgi:hypothetical protein
MASTGDGQEFGQPLDDAEDRCLHEEDGVQ